LFIFYNAKAQFKFYKTRNILILNYNFVNWVVFASPGKRTQVVPSR